MSYNDFVSNKDSLQLKLLSNLSERLRLDQSEIKNLFLDEEAYLARLKARVALLNTSSQAEVSFFSEQKKLTDMHVIKYMLLEEHYIKLFNSYVAEFDNKKKIIEGKKTELMQKLALLKSKDRFYRFVFKEEFENLYNINTSRLKFEELNIDTEAKVATLPISEEREVFVDKIFVSNYSNCIAGNYDTGENKFIYSIIDKSETTVFEAFKKGEGPLKLGITLSFRKEEIINKIILKEVSENLLSSIDVEDIRFNITNSKSVSIKNLVSKENQSFSMRSNGELHIIHLPVKCKSISIKLKAYKENVNSIESYYSIALRSIKLLRQKFKSKGEVQSIRMNLPAGYNSAQLEEVSFPSIIKGFYLNKNLSVDGGLSFEPSNNVTLLDGQSKEVIYSYVYEKKNEELLKGVALKSEDYFVDVISKSSYISKKISPNNMSLPFEGFIDDSFKVVQSKVLSRSRNREKSIKLGDLRNSGKNFYSIPVDLSYYEYDNLIVRVGDEIYNEVDEEALVNQDGVYFLNSSNQIVIFSERANPFLKVTLALSPKTPEVIERPEGYYLVIDENFEFDKNDIKVVTYIEDSGLKTKNLNGAAETKVFLEDEYIDLLSFKISKYSEETEEWVALDQSEYSLDAERGILLLDDSLLTEKFLIKYRNHIIKTLEKEEYEIWVKDNKVRGLYVYPEHLSYTEINETLAGGTSGWERVEKFDFENQVGPSSSRAVNSQGTRFLLSNKNIIVGSLSFKEGFQDFKEVAYKDGLSEHLNIKKMEQDYVPRIQKNNLGQIKFSLQYIPYSGAYSESITLYKAGEEIDSSRYLIEDRIVTLDLLEEEEISEGYYFSYSYLTEEKKDKTYSIDYKSGVLYTSEVVGRPEAAGIEYKITSVSLEYYIYNPIQNFEVDLVNSNIDIYTEEFLNINNLVKMFCFKNKSNFNFDGLEEYFSPIIYSLKVGFN